MELCMQNGAVLALCPNTAWQKTLLFEKLQLNAVNRAAAVKQTGGGKGVNVLRVLRRLGVPASIAGFVGGGGRQAPAPGVRRLRRRRPLPRF